MEKIFKDIARIRTKDQASKAERLCKLFEESGELAQAVNKSLGRKVKASADTPEKIKENICEEAADTIQCVMALVQECDISYEELMAALHNKNIKWQAVIMGL